MRSENGGSALMGMPSTRGDERPLMRHLAVVLISKNQEWNIGRLIGSVFDAVGTTPVEVVLVDSASSDRTVEIACEYPIKILRLCPDQRLTAALGRRVGFENTTGDPILFLDGDMELCEGWLQKGIEFLSRQKNAAAVCGEYIDVLRRTTGSQRKCACTPHAEEVADEIAYSGGAALYKRSVLDDAGSFNPFLHGDEEPELYLRIRRLGYLPFQINSPMVFHFTEPIEAPSTLIDRWRRNLYLGHGQVIRYHLKDTLLFQYLWQRQFLTSSVFGVALGLASFAAILATGRWVWFGLLLTLVMVFWICLVFRKKSFVLAFSGLLNRALSVLGLIVGISKAAPPIDSAVFKFDRVECPEKDSSSS